VFYNCRMKDREHEEWLENKNARKAAAKQNHTTPPISPKKTTEKKKEDGADDLDDRIWRGDAA